VIDSGIWPEHPSFADDGSYPDLGIVLDDSRPNCEFGNAAHNPDDVPFTCNQKLLGARQMLDTYRAFIVTEPFEYDSARDDDGHGTHTASTAAGNAGVSASMYGNDLGEISGIAPRARVIAYKGLGAGGGFTSDLAAAIDQAVFDGVDVINYSIGGGGSLPTGGDDIAFLFAADAGVFVATSAGNSGPGADTVGSPGNAPWLTTVGANTQDRFYEGEVKTKGGPKVKGASLTPEAGKSPFVDAEDAGGDLCLPGTLDPAMVTGNIVLCRRGAIARAAKSEAVAIAGGVGMVLYNNDDNDSLFTDTHAVPSVHINYTDGLRMKQYIDDQAAKGKDAEVEIRKTGKETKAKGSPSMTYFSSKGPNGPVPDIIKPDITAPGHQIVAGDSPGVNAFGDSFQAISGTSMSSPHVAGLFALLKQAHPDWSAAAAKSAIMTTANTKVRAEDRKTQATPFEMGAGEIDPGKVDRKGSAFNPGLVYDAGLFEYAAFTCGADLGIFTPGSCSFLEGLGIPSDASDLNMASIGIAELAGSQTVVRTVTNVSDDTVNYQAKVKEPKGYDVTVTPNRFTIAPGDSMTFEVTITSTGAPAGEWRFGSLELKGKGYKVVSPIAVNGALFDAPAEVAGSGDAGSASFDVLFGYTGSYSAAPHGLVPSTVLTGEIGQDPDTVYPSADDAPGPAGGVDKYPITLTDSAFLRIDLEIPGDDDIDLFLEDSGGTIIAASTNGGTDETIELVLPADGTYTLVVHGWGIPSADLGPPAIGLPYSVDTWSVPLTPGGGSLSIDSAPTSATLGTTGTVDVSWSGLTPGLSYLGAVSHTGDAGLLGLTLVSVGS
jgi:subtilisin family serine protease